MGQKWPDATVRSHAVLIAWNEVHHWNDIKNPVLAVWLSYYIILCIPSKGRFDVISWIFPAAQCPCDQDVVLLGKFCWSHHRCFLSVYLDYTSDMSHTARTGFLIPFWWCPLYCDKSIAWERALASCCYSPINVLYIQVIHYDILLMLCH